MGIVNQESILFNDTIYNNIAFGKPDTTLQEVEAAARIANAHEFILASENGYQTNIGDRGSKLSGGQKQRICIARAVLKNPPIMLLDEATSALDTESEKLVQEALNNLMQNRTSLIIAHRLSTIQNADIIIVVEDGNVVEQGSHFELVANDGFIKNLSRCNRLVTSSYLTNPLNQRLSFRWGEFCFLICARRSSNLNSMERVYMSACFSGTMYPG